MMHRIGSLSKQLQRQYAHSSTVSLASCSSPVRCMSTDSKDMEEYHLSTGVLYKGPGQMKLKLASGASVAQVAFWSWLKGTEKALPMDPVAVPVADWMVNPIWSDVGMGFSVMMVGFIAFYAKRSVAKIALVPGEPKLSITTHSFMGGLAEPVEIPLSSISVAEGTKADTNPIPLKVKDTTGFYLVDTDGEFFDRARFDQQFDPSAAVTRKDLKKLKISKVTVNVSDRRPNAKYQKKNKPKK